MAQVHQRCQRCGKARACGMNVSGGMALMVCAVCARQLDRLVDRPKEVVTK